MFCGTIQVKNSRYEILALDKDIPYLIKKTIPNLSVSSLHPEGELCNIQYIGTNDFEKDLVREVASNEYLAKLFQTKKHLFDRRDKNNKVLPTLYLSIVDFFEKDIASSTGIAIPRCLKYIDSSIWHYYVPVFLKDTQRTNFETDFKERLQIALNAILKNRDDGLYNLSVTQEQADFYARIVQQSYLEDIGAHKKRISPFLFHSEREIKDSLKKIRDRLSPYMPSIIGIDNSSKIDSNQSKAKWRFLLIDDFAKKTMKTYPPGQTTLCKEKQIRSVLDTLFVSSDCIEIVSVSSVAEAVNILKIQKFDLILLDYLLDYKPGGQREYGYELLDKIENDNELKEKSGPLGKYWIFPITSFDEAFTQKMREQGWNYNSKYWLLAQGACPLDTPESFKFYLADFMNSQLIGLGIEIKKCDRSNVYTLTEFLQQIFKDTRKARQRAIKNFNALYSIKTNYSKLKKDVRNNNNSYLVKSIYEDIEKYNSEFWEHIVFMMYLTAYPPANQWFRLTHEFIFIKDLLNEEVSNLIGDYINYMKGM